ncbi:MAG: hypothetical protein JNL80_17070 [Phycisphaerae bacterium]|jgi:hypothetical protein|nr:hypothetical protein [Phycisphaerae bacterium]
MGTPDPSSPRNGVRRLWALVTLAVVGMGVSLRAWLLFRTAVPPGVDAGYYPYQSRTLLELGRLAYDDVPLRFLLDAVLAKAIMLLTGSSVDNATLWISRAVDSMTLPIVAVPIMVAGYIWSGSAAGKPVASRQALAASAVMAISAITVRPVLDMIGDFQKQSMALALSALAWLATWGALRASSRSVAWRRGALASAFLLATAFTHVGTFGAAAIGCVAMLFARMWLGRTPVHRWLPVAIGVLALLGLAWLGMWSVAPAKAVALVAKPFSFYSEDGMDGPPSPLTQGWRGMIVYAAVLIVFGVVGFAMVRRASLCRDTSPADAAFALGMLVVIAVVTSPLLPGEYVLRLGLIAFTPLLLIVTYFLTTVRIELGRSPWPSLCRWVVILGVLGASLNSTMGSAVFRMPPMITAGGLEELRQWRSELATDFRTVVVARHGLEWWTGFALGSAVRMSEARASDFDRYEHVYVLKETRSTLEGMDPREPPMPREGRWDRNRRNDRQRGGPTSRMALAPIPADATVVRQGEWFTLYELKRPATERAPG